MSTRPAGFLDLDKILLHKVKTNSMHFHVLNVFAMPTHLCTMPYWVYGALWGFCYNCIINSTYSIIVLLFFMYE